MFMIKSYKLVFILTLIMGTMISISANTWFTSWLGLEVNLLSMIPLMLYKVNKSMTEASIKYFLTQAFASTMLIMSTSMTTFFTSLYSLPHIDFMIIFSLMMKTGLPPAHFWFPQVAKNLLWNQCLILFTWQKIAPLLLLTSFNMVKIMTMVSLAVMVGALGGLNQKNLKLMLTYSSINHSGWILTASLSNINLWMNYFSIYTMLSVCIISMINKTNIKTIPELFNFTTSKSYIYCFIFNIMSLGGLPPFLGFMAKLPVLVVMIKMKMNIMFLMMILASLLSLFFYARMFYNFMMMSFQKKHNFFFTNKTNNLLMTTCITMNLLAPLLINFM